MRRFLLLIPFLLAGCTEAPGSSPSLAIRPIEKIGRDMSEPVRPVQPPAAADAALRAKIDTLMAKVHQGQADFEKLLPRTQEAAAAAGAEGSESWVTAQQLLTALESARSPAPAALSELQLTITDRLAAGNGAGMAELQAAEAEAQRIVDAQADAIDRIRAKIG